MDMNSCRVCSQPARYHGTVSVCSDTCFQQLDPNPPYDFGNIERDTLANEDYRRVLFTSQQQQLVVQNILPTESIPAEVHPHTTQFIRIEQGSGYAVFNELRQITLSKTTNDFVLVGAGVKHEVRVAGTKPLKLYTIYSPPHHPHDLVQKRQPFIVT